VGRQIGEASAKFSQGPGRKFGDVSVQFSKGFVESAIKPSLDAANARNEEAFAKIRQQMREDEERRANEAALKAALPNGPRKK